MLHPLKVHTVNFPDSLHTISVHKGLSILNISFYDSVGVHIKQNSPLWGFQVFDLDSKSFPTDSHRKLREFFSLQRMRSDLKCGELQKPQFWRKLELQRLGTGFFNFGEDRTRHRMLFLVIEGLLRPEGFVE